jgi:hypothetical protein
MRKEGRKQSWRLFDRISSGIKQLTLGSDLPFPSIRKSPSVDETLRLLNRSAISAHPSAGVGNLRMVGFI